MKLELCEPQLFSVLDFTGAPLIVLLGLIRTKSVGYASTFVKYRDCPDFSDTEKSQKDHSFFHHSSYQFRKKKKKHTVFIIFFTHYTVYCQNFYVFFMFLFHRFYHVQSSGRLFRAGTSKPEDRQVGTVRRWKFMKRGYNSYSESLDITY